MSRPADDNSKRQRGFRLLNLVKTQRASPAKRLAMVMEELGVDKPYAQTIIATHKRHAQKEGKFITTYRINDKRNGKPCRPFLSKRGVYKVAVKKRDYLTPEAAKEAYINEQAKKINFAEAL